MYYFIGVKCHGRKIFFNDYGHFILFTIYFRDRCRAKKWRRKDLGGDPRLAGWSRGESRERH